MAGGMVRCRLCCFRPATTPLAPELQAQKRSIWCVRDCCGMVCATFTWLLILYADYVVVTCMILTSPSSTFSYFHGTVFHTLVILGILSHLRAMLSDPGTVPLGNATRENIMNLGLKQGAVIVKCPKCNCIKPERAHHCSVCKRCVRRMDHHCPWVNNCVGENNQKFFVLFTMYICASSFYSIFICINYVVMCTQRNWNGCWVAQQSPGYVVCTIFMVIEAIIFGLFTGCMFIDQMCSIWKDETGIETLKKEKPTWPRQRSWMNMYSVFGSRLWIWWLLPCASSRNPYERIVRVDDVESNNKSGDIV